jgi:GNAT superfamily N-acetyltransferase
MPTKQIEGKINAGQVIVAEEAGTAIGYCMGQDRYFKRDDVGIIYQLNVTPGAQRKLVGAMLLRAMFERAAYGCRLFCCWCAQDIEANYFWQSMGFVPLAFRTGSQKKSRTHIFWQRRTVEGDVTTPYWFPSQTNQGAIREDRLVLPIPPGVDWRDVMPVVLPNVARASRPSLGGEKKKDTAVPKALPAPIRGLHFGPPVQAKAAKEKPKREKKPKLKNDPALVAKARELRDRYLEQFNSGLSQGALPAGKYAVGRMIEVGSRQYAVGSEEDARLLPTANCLPPTDLAA